MKINFFKNKSEIFWVLISILVVIVIIFGQSLDFSFVNWDDPLHITNNKLVRDFTINDFFSNPEIMYSHTWFVQFIWGILFKYSSGNPYYFHLINVFFHVINSIMIYYVAKFILKNKLISLCIAVLFAAHPLHVEAVAWSSALKDILFSFFYLSGIILYIQYLNKNRIWKTLIICLLYFLAISSKIQALHLPIILILIELYKNSKIEFKNIFLYIALILLGIKAYLLFAEVYALYIFFNYKQINFIKINDILRKIKVYINSKKKPVKIILMLSVTLLLIGVTYSFIRSTISGLPHYWTVDNIIDNFSFPERILMSGFALVYYIKMFFLPINIIAVHPYPNFDIDGTVQSLYAFLIIYPILILIVVFIIRSNKIELNKKKQLFFGLMFFLINISFVLHIIPIFGRLIVADRYAYLAIFGLLIVLFVILDIFFKNNKLYLVLISACLLIFYTYQSKSYSSVWSNSINLYDDIIHKNPDIPFPYNNKALFYYYEGNYDLAFDNYALAIAKDSLYYDAYYNRALLYLDIRDYSNSVLDFSSAIKYSSFPDPEVLISRGWVYYLLGDYKSANTDYNEALKIDSTYCLALNNRALLKFDMGDIQGAFIDVNKAIEFDPNMYEAFNNRGWFKLQSNDIVGALHDFKQSYNLDSQYFNAVVNLAWANFLDNNYYEAAKYYKEAYLINSNSAQIAYYLGLSEMNCGNNDIACYYLKLAGDMGSEDANSRYLDLCTD